MDTFYTTLTQKIARGEQAVLALIIENYGSAPRGAGAAMAAYADGSFTGTVGGGAVEYMAQKMCTDALKERRSFLHFFNLSPNEEADLGMVCGGNVLIFFQFLDGASSELKSAAAKLLALQDSGTKLWSILHITEGGTWQGGIADAKGEILLHVGQLPSAEADLSELLQKCPVLRKEESSKWFAQPLSGQGNVYIFGAGHVARHLLPELRRVFFDCILYDDRKDFANPDLFPYANRIIVSNFDSIQDMISIDSEDYVVIMTRGHLYDYEVLKMALRTGARYIGMIGSRHKISATFTRLISEDGFTYKDVKRVYTPIGLDIGGETPEEIAVGVAAQMIAVRNGKLK